MVKSGFFTGLDIGTSSVKVLVAEYTDNEMNVIGVSSVKSAGVKDGIIVNIDVAAGAINKAQEQAEDDDTDPFLMDGIQTVVETGQASTSFIQRRFKVGYARAGRIIDQMEERGVISGYQGSKPREVLMTKERWEELKMGTSEENKN